MNIFDSHIVYLITPNFYRNGQFPENGKFLNIYLAGNIFCFIFTTLFLFCKTVTFCNAFVMVAKSRCFVAGLSLLIE